MARPRDDPGDAFGRTELALAGGMTLSNFDYLDREGLVPQDRDIRTLKRVAVIGAIHAAGVPLLLSARIASAVLWEFNQSDGEVPSGLNQFLAKLRSQGWQPAPRSPDLDSDYWLHRELIQHPNIYATGKANRVDAMIEIVDREFVFLALKDAPIRTLPIYASEDRLPDNTSCVGRIEGWKRNVSGKFIHFLKELPTIGAAGHDEAANRLIDQFADARENAVGMIVVNVSLAVRCGLDAIAEHRAARLKRRSRRA